MTQNVYFLCRQMFLMPVLGLVLISAVSSGDTLQLIRKIPHSGYSEGLDFHNGFLWHSLPKEILKIDPKDGTILNRFPSPTEHSESLAWFQGALWNLSFTDDGIYRGDLNNRGELTFVKKGTTPELHGWGLTHHETELVMTGNFSSKIYFVNPKTLRVTRSIETKIKDVEDLAWDGELLWTSSFSTEKGKIFSVDPKTGKTIGTFSLPEDNCPVIDGIAYDTKGLWITGKECPSIYYVKKPISRAVTSKK